MSPRLQPMGQGDFSVERGIVKGCKSSISNKPTVFEIQWSYESLFPGLVGSGV